MSDKIYSPLIQDPVTKQFYKRELNTHKGIVVRSQGGHCYINGSETTLTENLMMQRDQYKTERDKLKVENKKLKIKNEYLLNVIKMSEHIQMHTDLEEN